MTKISDKKVRLLIYSKYKGHCAYCGCKLKPSIFTIDHIKPKRRGDKTNNGADSIDNYNPCCLSCNSSKATFSIEAWRKEIELKYDRLIRDSSQFRILNRFGLIKRQNEVIFYFEKH